MQFLTDENVPDSVGDLLQSHGHEVVRAREAFGVETYDAVIVEGAKALGAIVVTSNKRHFLRLSHRLASTLGGVIILSCNQTVARSRAADYIDLIEFCLRTLCFEFERQVLRRNKQ